MSRRLALVSLDWTRAKDPPLSLGHASILASMKAHEPSLEDTVIPFERSVIDPSFHPEEFAESKVFFFREIENRRESQILLVLGLDCFLHGNSFLESHLWVPNVDDEHDASRVALILGRMHVRVVDNGVSILVSGLL